MRTNGVFNSRKNKRPHGHSIEQPGRLPWRNSTPIARLLSKQVCNGIEQRKSITIGRQYTIKSLKTRHLSLITEALVYIFAKQNVCCCLAGLPSSNCDDFVYANQDRRGGELKRTPTSARER